MLSSLFSTALSCGEEGYGAEAAQVAPGQRVPLADKVLEVIVELDRMTAELMKLIRRRRITGLIAAADEAMVRCQAVRLAIDLNVEYDDVVQDVERLLQSLRMLELQSTKGRM
jgi:hypothetical protein